MTSSSQPLMLIYKGSNSLIYYQAASEYDRPVVVKVLNTEHPTAQQLARFNNEYEITKELAVEGVRKAIAQTRLEDKPALVLEYITGQTLKQAFVEQRQSLVDFLQVAIRIAQILGELHQHHLIHRDINSHNILANLETKQVNIIDFSLASRLDLRVQHLGNPEGLAGTLAYISPEQTGRMNRVVDYRTDLYSLGATFYQLLAGHLPFESNDPLALVHAHLAKAPRPVTALNLDVPTILSDIIIKLLAKNAEDRYQSAFGLKADLERCLAVLTGPQELQNLKSLSFKLGQDDFSGRFQLPQKLYGRSKEITTLLTVFERVAAGSQELMLITGDPGTGKSALVAEVHKPITEKRGYFISGKFDQYQQHTPYAAFSQAFNQFANLLLTEREATLQQWRDKILAAVGSNGAVLTEVMPHLKKVIGPQPAVTKLGGQENRNRFNLTFQNFVQAISTAEHPLVVFIDDWQWADLASLELLKVLLANEANSHLLLIGAYRDNKMDRTHPFMMTLNDLTAAEITMQIIKLDNLQPADVSQLIQESIGGTVVDNQSLVELVYEKTQGNAFFTRQFLQNLYEEGWLRFDFNTHRWMWDMAQLKAQNITANVVKLMANKLKKLSQQTIYLLQLAACIGNKFDLQTLALISQMSETTVLRGLEEALNQGLIIPLDDYFSLPGTVAQANFSFLHDQVQQAAYVQIPALERQTVHLEIGRLLLANTPAAALEQRVFDIVQHYNQAGSLVTDEPERLRLAELNMQAADLAYGAAAFHSAQSYLEAALALMPADAWISRYDQMLALHSQLATVLSLTGEFEQLNRIVQITEIQAHSIADTAQVKRAEIRASLSGGNYVEAIELGLNFIEAMGISLNRDPSPEEAFSYLQETAEWLHEARIKNLHSLPDAPDKVGLILKVAEGLNGPTYMTNIYLCMVFVSRITRLCIEQGLNLGALNAFMTFGLLLSATLHDIPKARLLIHRVQQLLKEKYHLDSVIAPMNTTIGGFIVHRHDHLKNTLPILAEGVQKGLTSGSFEFVGYCAWWFSWHHLFVGTPLTQVEAISQQAIETCQKVQMERFKDWSSLVYQVTLNLQGKSETAWILKGEAYDEDKELAFSFQINDLAEALRIFFYRGWLHYLFGYSQQAVDLFRQAEPYLPNGAGLYLVPLFYLYDTLANAAVYDDRAPDEQAQIVERINHNLKAFEVWVRFAPMNHQHKQDLMEAEKARLEGKYWEAVEFYQKAIQGAKENEFLSEEALANELYSQFWLDRGHEELARVYLQKAQNLYSLWGAEAKVKQLQAKYESRFGHLLAQPQVILETAEITPVVYASTSSQSVSKSWLDIASLLKANQTLSQTVQLTDLLAEMMKILLENAGAEKAFILYQTEEDWFIEAGGEVEDQAIQTGLHLPLSGATMLSLNVCNYVIRSGQAAILANAAEDPQFATDAYLQKQAVKSVLCLPIWHKGKLELVLYLENNLAEGTFTERHLELLQLLSGQMAISLENALMVDSLKTLLAEYKRTEETLRLTRLTVDSVTDAVYWIDSEAARFVDVNEAACRLLGYTRAELLTMSVADIDPGFSLTEWPELWKYIKEKGKLTREAEHQTRDGRLIPVEIIANYIQFGDRELDCAIVRNITRRKQMDEALRQSEERLQQAVRVSNIGIFDHNHLTNTFYWSPEQRQNYGWEPEETVTLSEFLKRVYAEDRERIEEAVWRAHDPTGDGLFDVEHRIVRQDGAVRWVATRSQTFFKGEGSACRPLRTIGATLDITEFRQVENQLKVSLQEKEVLLKEIHHRVKNNMQIISSLLDLQADNIREQAIREIFQESRQRIKSMALIHERLYQSKDLARIDFAEYVESLTGHLMRSYGARADHHIELHLAIEPVSLSIETAIPCGLIINELVSNAFKHAFSDSKTGQIWIELSTTENQQLSLIVKDNGVGFPKDIDLHRTTSLGLTLVNTLAKQINSILELNKSSGTEFKITFSNRQITLNKVYDEEKK